MIAEGALANPAPPRSSGCTSAWWRSPPATSRTGDGEMASADVMRMVVRGRQTHGAVPGRASIPIVVASQIVLGMQTVVSRQVDLTTSPAVVTVGSIQGGVRNNIVPDSVVMLGTIRTRHGDARHDHARVRRTAEHIAQASGATAEVTFTNNAPVTSNDPALTARMLPTLDRVAGAANVSVAKQTTGAEDFGFFQQKVPGLFVFLGVMPKGADPATVAPNHSPNFFADESALPTGVRTLAHLAADFLSGSAQTTSSR
jgi:amidohydrolase